MKILYEMTDEEFEEIMEACKPVPLIATQCGVPMSPQENANAAWLKLGKKRGFISMTVEPSPKGNKFFLAEPMMSKE